MERTSSPARREPGVRTSTARRIVQTVVAAVFVGAAGLSIAPGAAPAAVQPTQLTEASQSTYISVPDTFSISLNLRSNLPPDTLGIRFTLSSLLSSRDAFFASTENERTAAESCLDASPLLPLTGLTGTSTGGTVQYSLPFVSSSTAPSCYPNTTFSLLDCQTGLCLGTYPLTVQLVDTKSDQTVASFTTHVVVIPTTKVSRPLNVALIAQLGASTSLAPNGSPRFTRSPADDMAEVRALANTTARARLSLELYPDLLLALQRAGATSLISAIDNLVSHGLPGARVELLTAPYANIDPSALAAHGLDQEVQIALSDGNTALGANFHRTLPVAPYETTSPIDQRGLSVLEASCLSEFVVSESSVPAAILANGPPTAPLIVRQSRSCPDSSLPEVFVADGELGSEFTSNPDDPVLAGENVLAGLAQVFFELPNALSKRGVTIVVPETVNPRVLEVVENGLHDNPILSTTQLSNLFGEIGTGANGTVQSTTIEGTPSGNAPSAAAVGAAKDAVRAVKSTMPNNRSLISSLAHGIVEGESAALDPDERAPYLQAPKTAITRTIGGAITVAGSGQVTLTARTGKVPITIQSAITKNGPLNVLVHLASSSLVLGEEARNQRIALDSKDKDLTVEVGTHASGFAGNDLEVIIYSATGNYVLARRDVVVRSTVVSGVAIALSIAALLVLLGWWSRSIFRTRKKRAAEQSATT